MISKNFRFGVIIRVLFIIANILLITYLVTQTNYYVSQFILILVFIGQIVSLIRYLEKTNILLTRFLEAIEYSDFTSSFKTHELGSNFDELNNAFGSVIEKFKEERSQKEESIRYLETVVQHIGIGLICFNSKGQAILLNTAIKRLLKVATLHHMESLKEISKQLYDNVSRLKGGNRTLVRVQIKNETLQLAIYATEFKMRDDFYKLVSFQNIHTELEEKEMEAWQNLTQVLAHEIMNSITPIASLSSTVHMLLEKHTSEEKKKQILEKETLTDVKEALNTITTRSQGLMRFVNSYRDFTQIPEPRYEIFNLSDILNQVSNLMRPEADKENIIIETEVEPESLEITADRHLIEQALINLVKNAIRALSAAQIEEAKVSILGSIDQIGKVTIKVIDNGPGIKKSAAEKIFIPFYSMKKDQKQKGSGIGLSLSKQIMRLHGGSLTLQTHPGKGSEFTMRF